MFEEDPTLFEEDPTLFEDDPTLFEWDSTLFVEDLTEDPTLFEEDPTLFEWGPTLLEEDPALFEWGPTLLEEDPALFEEDPTEDPTLFEEDPTLFEWDSTLFEEDPTLFEWDPTLFEEDPTFYEEDLSALSEEEEEEDDDDDDDDDDDESSDEFRKIRRILTGLTPPQAFHSNYNKQTKLGFFQSVLKSLEAEDENETPTFQRGNSISSRNYYSNTAEKPQDTHRNQILKPSHQWLNENDSSTLSQQMKSITISVPNSRISSSFDHTIVDDKVKKKGNLSAVTSTKNQDQRTTGMGSTSGVKKKDRKGAVMINYTPPETGKWIKHYSSRHRILLVGEGDFSFSTCLAAAFGFALNMIATSLDSQDFLMRNYHYALDNFSELRSRNCTIMHEIDATKMTKHVILGGMAFDRIIFNFPFAGFFKELPRGSQLLLHRTLVSKFLKNAKEMISENGEIHITHKTNGFHMEWRIESIASAYGLRLIEAVDFNGLDYPGYNTKCGFGGDNNFNCYPSKTYKFGLGC